MVKGVNQDQHLLFHSRIIMLITAKLSGTVAQWSILLASSCNNTASTKRLNGFSKLGARFRKQDGLDLVKSLLTGNWPWKCLTIPQWSSQGFCHCSDRTCSNIPSFLETSLVPSFQKGPETWRGLQSWLLLEQLDPCLQHGPEKSPSHDQTHFSSS